MQFISFESRRLYIQYRIYLALKLGRVNSLRNLQKFLISSLVCRCKAISDSLDFFYQNFDVLLFSDFSGNQKLLVLSMLFYILPLNCLDSFLVLKKKYLSFFFSNLSFYNQCVDILFSYALLPVSETLSDRLTLGFRLFRVTYDIFSYLKVKFLRKFRGIWFYSFSFFSDLAINSWILKHFPFQKKFLHILLQRCFNEQLFIPNQMFIFNRSDIYSILMGFLLSGLL